VLAANPRRADAPGPLYGRRAEGSSALSDFVPWSDWSIQGSMLAAGGWETGALFPPTWRRFSRATSLHQAGRWDLRRSALARAALGSLRGCSGWRGSRGLGLGRGHRDGGGLGLRGSRTRTTTRV